METAILLWIHERAHPLADSVFYVSHAMGTVPFCTLVVTLAVIASLLSKRRELALLWIALGISTYLLQAGLKATFARPRPELWSGALSLTSYAFPSGHAIAGATFYPLLAHMLAERFPLRRTWLLASGVLLAWFIGFGRLYLGVHWPSDVIAGWAIGAGQTYLGLRVVMARRLDRQKSAHPDPGGSHA